jgi:hypothetical protein
VSEEADSKLNAWFQPYLSGAVYNSVRCVHHNSPDFDRTFLGSGQGGASGGKCVCPSGNEYFVGQDTTVADSASKKLKCSGGGVESEFSNDVGPWSYKSVECGLIGEEATDDAGLGEDFPGTDGGYCQCPNGEVFPVGDNFDQCKSLVCINGQVVTDHPCKTPSEAIGKRFRHKGVICERSTKDNYKFDAGETANRFKPEPTPDKFGYLIANLVAKSGGKNIIAYLFTGQDRVTEAIDSALIFPEIAGSQYTIDYSDTKGLVDNNGLVKFLKSGDLYGSRVYQSTLNSTA